MRSILKARGQGNTYAQLRKSPFSAIYERARSQPSQAYPFKGARRFFAHSGGGACEYGPSQTFETNNHLEKSFPHRGNRRVSRRPGSFYTAPPFLASEHRDGLRARS